MVCPVSPISESALRDRSEGIEIRAVGQGPTLKQFVKFPFKINKDNPIWVPPLIVDRMDFFNKDKNPFYKRADVELFMAFQNGAPVGRIAACINHDHNDFHQEKMGSFGFFESVDDSAVAHALFDTAAEWLRQRGQTRIMGPLNFSTNHEVGFLVEGYDLPAVVMMPYNPPYYLKLAESWGLTKAKDLVAFKIDSSPGDRIRRIAERVRKRHNVEIRNLNLKDFDAEINRIRLIYNQAWSKNWGFVPLQEEEFAHIAKDMKMIIDPDIAFIAEIDGRPVGFSLSLPNIYEAQIHIRDGRLFPTGIFKLLWTLKIKKSIRSTRIITLGVIHEYQRRGIEAVFYIETYDRSVKNGYDRGEISWILEDNEMMIKAAQAMGSEQYKKYRVLEKPL